MSSQRPSSLNAKSNSKVTLPNVLNRSKPELSAVIALAKATVLFSSDMSLLPTIADMLVTALAYICDADTDVCNSTRLALSAVLIAVLAKLLALTIFISETYLSD